MRVWIATIILLGIMAIGMGTGAVADEPAMDGAYYCFCENGVIFRFWPDAVNGPRVEYVDTSWRAEGEWPRSSFGMDVLQMCVGPEGRYIYFFPRYYPAPLVQYDVLTGTKKALCWPYEHFFDTYGYFIGNSYGMEISEDGSFIVVLMNGTFEGRDYSKGLGEIAFGHPSVMVIEIPEEERPLD